MMLVLLVLAWVLPWKGVALWKAAKNGHKTWFIAFLIINTMALLEAVYIFYFSKRGNENSEVGERAGKKLLNFLYINGGEKEDK